MYLIFKAADAIKQKNLCDFFIRGSVRYNIKLSCTHQPFMLKKKSQKGWAGLIQSLKMFVQNVFPGDRLKFPFFFRSFPRQILIPVFFPFLPVRWPPCFKNSIKIHSVMSRIRSLISPKILPHSRKSFRTFRYFIR